jgi:hypothetical protein
MAGTVTVTTKDLRSYKQYTVAWTSDASGNANGTTFIPSRGHLREVHFIPSATAPTDLYDVVVNDANGVDLSIGGGANCPTAATRIAQISPAVIINGITTIEVKVSNAGDSKLGTVILYVLDELFIKG